MSLTGLFTLNVHLLSPWGCNED